MQRNIAYDVEIVGGIPVTGTVYFSAGRIDAFTLPDNTRIEVSGFGGVSGPPYSSLTQIGNLILLAIHDSPLTMMVIEQSAPKVRADSAPAYV